MKQLFIFLVLVITANAKVAVLDIALSSQLADGAVPPLYPSQAGYNAGGAKGCRVKNFGGTDKLPLKGTGDCPVGSARIDGDIPVCKTLTKVVHQGANGFDFETENVVSAPTQIADLVSFSGDQADATGNTGTKDKFLLYRVHLQAVNEAKYDACHVTVGGALVDAVKAPGTPPSVLSNGVYKSDTTALDKQFLSATGKVSCEFRLANHGYLGLVSLNVTFTKVELQMEIGEKPFDSVEAHVRFVPDASSDDYWHLPAQLLATASPTSKDLFPDHDITKTAASGERYKSALHTGTNSVFIFKTDGDYGDGYNKITATATKGTVSLPVMGTFYDKRYKVVEQSGAESLQSGVGNGLMRKEGMDIHFDFQNFYDARWNSFTNKKIDMTPVPLYNGANGYDLVNGPQGYAQYRLEHTYVMKYGGSYGNEMPHFQREYLSCPLCDARIVFKAFEQDNAYTDGGLELASALRDYLLRYHVTIVTTNLPAATNTIALDDVDVDIVTGVNGHSTKQDGSNIALRLPTSLDPQYPDGHPIGEFFTVKKAATKIDYASLVATYTILGTRLVGSGTVMPILVNCGTGYGSGPLYKLGTDIVALAQEIFDRDCRVKIQKTGFGQESTLTYTNAANAATISTILQTDDRQIMAGNTELSILRRKTDTSATNSGPQVTFSVSKITGNSNPISFTIKGSHTMLGYGNDGLKCDQNKVCATKEMRNVNGVCVDCATQGVCTTEAGALTPPGVTHDDYVAYGKQCRGVLNTNEEKVTTEQVDGVSKSVTIRSSSDCFLYMDVELVDDSAMFARYALRLPCVRTTDQLNDQLNLTYGFSTSYSLSDNKVSAEIDYARPPGMDLSVTKKGFGSCGKDSSNFDTLITPSTCTDTGTPKPVGGWLDDSISEIVLDAADNVDLDMLKKCGTGSVTESTDGKSYVMNHYLGLVYARAYLSGGRIKSRTYCQDQKFVTTIRKDATASVTVATLVSPTLTRSVMVSGLNWVRCNADDNGCAGSDKCYKYRIDLDVTEQSDGGAWANATLSTVFEPAVGGVDSDNMVIVESLKSQVDKNYFSLESACGPVDSCDANSAHYSAIVDGTEKDLIIRGANEGVNVDTAVNIETKFVECPLESATIDLGGKLEVGMGLLCASSDGNGGYAAYGTANNGGGGAKSSVDSDVTMIIDSAETPVQRCATALASSKAKASAQVFLDGLNSTGLTDAATGGWHFRDIDWSIERFERDLLGQKDGSKKISSDLIFEMRHTSNSNPVEYTCTKKTGILFGLPNAFDSNILKCPTGTTEADISAIEFDLAPLQSANMDVFEVRVDAIMRNTNLDSRRRLRGVFQINLRADGELEASSGSFEILPATKEISDAIYEDPKTPEEHTANNSEVIMIIAIVVLAIMVIVLVIRCWCAKGGPIAKTRAMAGMNEDSALLQTEAEKTSRFSNLRY